ncbi:MAG TPA: alginate lyase family protein [Pyrinomonadaceae bacterium]|nr:alginate lyase family protein [Pyrinomonadaceae bacterium]
MKIISKTKRILRGDVNARTAALEAMRRVGVKNARRKEQAQLAELNQQPARLREEFARIRAADLLAHFHSRTRPKFFPGFQDLATTARLQTQIFPEETARLIQQAKRVIDDHCWPLLGFGDKCFGADEIHWNRDPLSGFSWPLDYHADINLMRNDGSDARVAWELNRGAHFITLGRAYAITDDDKISEAFFRQLAGWREQNPVARGVNWNCAMEVALRAMNLLGAFALSLHAPQMDEIALKEFLKTFDQHGAHIQRHLEFSHIATSNHYLADVVGLLWIGLMLPELETAREWREFGFREMLTEMDKQVLPDGADYEASTGYHRLKVELFLYSFVLCHLNGLDIGEKYWSKLRGMVEYMRAYLRPDARAPLVGDSDSGQVFPIVRRAGDDHAYLLALGAAVFQEPRFKIGTHASGMQHKIGTHASGMQHAGGVRTDGGVVTEELLWLLGERGMRDYDALPASEASSSCAFADAGVYLLRDADLYLHFNAGGIGVNGRGSHGHNDALSIEVSACGTAFIVDPGSYLYTADLHERHLFRSTAYHSTVQVDGAEQNTIDQSVPFVIGNEARPHVMTWESNADADTAVGEHGGYQRLASPITHRRTIRFDKRKRFWLVHDQLPGEGTHEFSFRFHVAPSLHTKVRPDGIVEVCDKMSGARLLIVRQQPERTTELEMEAALEPRYSSRDYGEKEPSVSVCWSVRSPAPLRMGFVLIPIRPGEDENARMKVVSEPGAVATGSSNLLD